MGDEEKLTTRQAITECADAGVKITKYGLMLPAIKMGFGRKKGKHWEFDKDGISGYIGLRQDKPEAGWLSVSDASAKSGISSKKIYLMIDQNEVPSKYFLSMRKRFVNYKELIKKTKEGEK